MENQNEVTNYETPQGASSSSQNASTTQKKIPILPILICCFGILSGIMVIIYSIGISIDISASTPGNYKNSRDIQFGADFYTESYAATAAAANNVGILGQDVANIGNTIADVANSVTAFRIIPVTMGIFMILFFALKLCELIRVDE